MYHHNKIRKDFTTIHRRIPWLFYLHVSCFHCSACYYLLVSVSTVYAVLTNQSSVREFICFMFYLKPQWSEQSHSKCVHTDSPYIICVFQTYQAVSHSICNTYPTAPSTLPILPVSYQVHLLPHLKRLENNSLLLDSFSIDSFAPSRLT